MAWSSKIEGLYNKANFVLDYNLSNDFADFFIGFVKDLKMRPDGYGILFPEKGNLFWKNLVGESPWW